jgi:hypothetical protein
VQLQHDRVRQKVELASVFAIWIILKGHETLLLSRHWYAPSFYLCSSKNCDDSL